MAKKEQNKPVDKKVFTFFIMAFPTLFIIALGRLGTEFSILMYQVVLAFFQFVLIRQFLNSYYDFI